MPRKSEPKSLEELHAHMESCRTDMDTRLDVMGERLDKGSSHMKELHVKTDANTQEIESLTTAIKSLTAAIENFLSIWSALDGFATVVNWGVKVGKVVGAIALTLSAIWAFLHFGVHGK